MTQQVNRAPIWYPLLFLPCIYLIGRVLYLNWGWWRGPDDLDVPGLIAGIVFGTIGSIVLLLIAGGIATGLSAIVRAAANQEWRICWRGKMASLRGFDGIEGSVAGGLFMICGQIGSQIYYRYYTKGPDGAFHPNKWRAGSNTRVFEEKRKDGEAVQWKRQFKNDWVGWFALPPEGLCMDFHVPKGSIKHGFELE